MWLDTILRHQIDPDLVLASISNHLIWKSTVYSLSKAKGVVLVWDNTTDNTLPQHIMADVTRPSTPPHPSPIPQSDITPEQVRRREEQRLKAKALREQRDAESEQRTRLQPNNTVAGQKRSAPPHVPYEGTRASERTHRDARQSQTPAPNQDEKVERSVDMIQPARSFARNKYIEYDFSAMTDTKGGFLTSEDDPHNRALHSDPSEQKPAGMTQREWERQQLDKKLRQQRAGPYEPNLGHVKREDGQCCRECSSLDIDFSWVDIFNTRICSRCKEANPEKYSLLTKSEAREDYLLTDPELRDTELLPRLEKPNPHKSTWQPMLLFLRYQVEEYAFSDKKWGSGEALDAEFERRMGEKKRRREVKFKSKLRDLKKRTRVEAYRRGVEGSGDGKFGDEVRTRLGNGSHEHEWGRTVQKASGETARRCITCGMEVEELEF